MLTGADFARLTGPYRPELLDITSIVSFNDARLAEVFGRPAVLPEAATEPGR